MNRPTGVAAAISILRDAYPRADFPERTAALYASMLADLDDLLAVEAVKRLIRRSSFLPSIAEIRREVAEATVNLPTGQEAWEMVNDPKWSGNLPAPVAASLVAMGGRWALRNTDEIAIFRAQFLKDYEGRRETAIVSIMGALSRTPLAALTTSGAARPRPIFERLRRRTLGMDLGAPSEDEKRDAIRLLEAGTMAEDPRDDALYAEAESVLREWSD